MRAIGTIAAIGAIVISLVMVQGVWADDQQVRFAESSSWTYPPDVADQPPMETVGHAAFPLYMTCYDDDCAAPESVEIGDGLPGYLEPAPPALTSPSAKPYYDDHVEGSHRTLVGFLIMEHCQCDESGYVIEHHSMRLRVPESDLARTQGLYVGFLQR